MEGRELGGVDRLACEVGLGGVLLDWSLLKEYDSLSEDDLGGVKAWPGGESCEDTDKLNFALVDGVDGLRPMNPLDGGLFKEKDLEVEPEPKIPLEPIIMPLDIGGITFKLSFGLKVLLM